MEKVHERSSISTLHHGISPAIRTRRILGYSGWITAAASSGAEGVLIFISCCSMNEIFRHHLCTKEVAKKYRKERGEQRSKGGKQQREEGRKEIEGRKRATKGGGKKESKK